MQHPKDLIIKILNNKKTFTGKIRLIAIQKNDHNIVMQKSCHIKVTKIKITSTSSS